MVIYLNDVAVGCGALRPYTDDMIELKRMYIPLEQRNKGLATVVLKE